VGGSMMTPYLAQIAVSVANSGLPAALAASNSPNI
jgi:hypothetical protein